MSTRNLRRRCFQPYRSGRSTHIIALFLALSPLVTEATLPAMTLGSGDGSAYGGRRGASAMLPPDGGGAGPLDAGHRDDGELPRYGGGR